MSIHGDFNPLDPHSWLGTLWLAWVVVWVVAAFTVKSTRTREPLLSRIFYLIPIFVAAELLFSPRLRFGFLVDRFLPMNSVVEWVGVVVTALGIAFTFWARFHLGRNWSGQVVIKEEHELIRSGPYSFVRHPIYTGLLLAVLGTALVISEVRTLLALALVGY